MWPSFWETFGLAVRGGLNPGSDLLYVNPGLKVLRFDLQISDLKIWNLENV
jgi:hypothetical protein